MGPNIRNFYEHKFDGSLENFIIFLDLSYGKFMNYFVLSTTVDLNTNCRNKEMYGGPCQKFLSKSFSSYTVVKMMIVIMNNQDIK